jgi:hypothetical protein
MSALYDEIKDTVIQKYFPKNEKYGIDDVFKIFSAEVIEDIKKGIKKGKFTKNTLNTVIDAHRDTQLLDIRSLYLQEEVDRIGSQLTLSADVQNFSYYDATTACERIDIICLPFNNNFIQIDSTEYCFIREYGDNVYTGTFLYKVDNAEEFLGNPFTITSKYGVYTIKFTGDTDLEGRQIYSKVVATMIHMLSKISYKLHYIYTTDLDDKNSRIHTPDNKRNKKPIYIYVSKNQTKTIKHYEKTYQNLKQLKTWLVRGHWRRLQDPTKFGKNPQGNYVVEGFTWVKPSQKGNKNLQVEQNTYVTI